MNIAQKEKLLLKKSNRKTICFALYEKVDEWAYKSIYRKLACDNIFNITRLRGFSYDAYIKDHRISKKYLPSLLTEDKICFSSPADIFDQIFLFLIKRKFNSFETKILLKQMEFERNRLKQAIDFYKPDLLVVPEDTDAVRGRLAATIAQYNKVKTMVVLPLYYEWITIYPLMGKRIANAWVIPGLNYKKQLLQYNVEAKTIFKEPLNLQSRPTAWINKNEDKLFEQNIKKNKYYVAALQDNDEQDVFVKMLIASFLLIPEKILVFKHHPAADAHAKRKLKKIYSNKYIYFLDKIDLNKLIYHSEGLLTVSSTSALNAVRLKKPVIIINVSPFPLDISYLIKDVRCFKVASTPDELRNIIMRLNSAKERKKYLSRQNILVKHYFTQHDNRYKKIDLIKLIKRYAS